ncbi:transposable element Tc3 transposase [Trichonephila clavipes]|nr:transposable element Tc3 transposase [Trichonephila clavipes]
MITNFFIPELNNHDVQELWFQQDEATCHTARAIIELLKDTLGDRLISRFGPVNWPPRSCDLTPLDYFLWGYVKSLVYADKPQTLDHLEDNIRRVIADIRPQMLEKVIENRTSGLNYIRASVAVLCQKSYLKLQNCRELLGKIKGKIVFQRVPSHCGLWGNERADFLAKKGTGILQNFRRDLTLHSAKLEIKRNFRESFRNAFRLTASRVARDKPWSTLCKKSHGIPSSLRAAAVAKFKLLTGHDCLCAHLFRFNLVTSPICVLCDTGQDMTAAHLDECSALKDLNCIVKRYWSARCLMT